MGRHDYDTPWKEALAKYLPDFFSFFFPSIDSDIDWAHQPRYLDKELRKLAPDSRAGRQVTDTLVEVRRRDGGTALVLVHIEVQNQPEAGFAQRMQRYYNRLLDHYEQPICSLAILGDAKKSWRPTSCETDVWGTKQRFEFPVAKLLDFESRLPELEASTNPFALLLAATIHVQRTGPNSPLRREAKFKLVRGLYERGLSAAEVRGLFRLLDWVMMLTPDQRDTFNDDLYDFERSKSMPYITSVEQRGIEKGLERGLEQGLERGLEQGLERERESLRAAIARALESRFGPIPERVKSHLSTIANTDRLVDLVGFVAGAPTLEDALSALEGEQP